mmetsp:Transcript_132422/g.295305  ORF Transcript_132422/g.295305 Transcript_132422/m.295305 type:complete len:219 (+) Transcript_132422:163-819(+)
MQARRAPRLRRILLIPHGYSHREPMSDHKLIQHLGQSQLENGYRSSRKSAGASFITQAWTARRHAILMPGRYVSSEKTSPFNRSTTAKTITIKQSGTFERQSAMGLQSPMKMQSVTMTEAAMKAPSTSCTKSKPLPTSIGTKRVRSSTEPMKAITKSVCCFSLSALSNTLSGLEGQSISVAAALMSSTPPSSAEGTCLYLPLSGLASPFSSSSPSLHS